MPKRALITGITGQDGSYLAELLLSKDYEVHGIIRRASTFNTGRLDHIYSGSARQAEQAVAALRRPERRQRAGAADRQNRSRTKSTISPRKATCA